MIIRSRSALPLTRPLTCCSAYLIGISNCSWSSCRHGCTAEVYKCWQVTPANARSAPCAHTVAARSRSTSAWWPRPSPSPRPGAPSPPSPCRAPPPATPPPPPPPTQPNCTPMSGAAAIRHSCNAQVPSRKYLESRKYFLNLFLYHILSRIFR